MKVRLGRKRSARKAAQQQHDREDDMERGLHDRGDDRRPRQFAFHVDGQLRAGRIGGAHVEEGDDEEGCHRNPGEGRRLGWGPDFPQRPRPARKSVPRLPWAALVRCVKATCADGMAATRADAALSASVLRLLAAGKSRAWRVPGSSRWRAGAVSGRPGPNANPSPVPGAGLASCDCPIQRQATRLKTRQPARAGHAFFARVRKRPAPQRPLGCPFRVHRRTRVAAARGGRRAQGLSRGGIRRGNLTRRAFKHVSPVRGKRCRRRAADAELRLPAAAAILRPDSSD